MRCRHCGATVTLPFVDLGSAPPSNSFLTTEALQAPEKWYPLRVLTCTRCWLVQTEDYAHHLELFSADYAYFSSYSTTWLRHAEQYVSAMIQRFGLDRDCAVMEVGCNDGYLLQYVRARGIPCLGIEPTSGTAEAARAKGIEVIQEFFGANLAAGLRADGRTADLVAANNVLAHVPDINDFVTGFSRLLKPAGVATFEFPHLLQLVQGRQFDTIYHEHYSYLSLTSVLAIFERNGLSVFDVETLSTHGGSLRVFAQRSDSGRHEVNERVAAMRNTEVEAGMTQQGFYEGFQTSADDVKNDFLGFVLDARKAGKTVVAYGAAAKGSTLMNYAGTRQDLIRFVVDRNPAKQGTFMPGSRIPIVDEPALVKTKADYVIVLPWNLKAEVIDQLRYVSSWGGRFVTAVPRLEVIS